MLDNMFVPLFLFSVAILLLVEYFLIRVLGRRHFRLLPHLLAIVVSWFLNIPLAILSLKVLETIRSVNICHISGGGIGVGLAFYSVSLGVWLVGLLCYQVYGFLAGRGHGSMVLLIGNGTLLGLLGIMLVLSLAVRTTLVFDAPLYVLILYIFMVFEGNFYGMLLVDNIGHAMSGGRPDVSGSPSELHHSPQA